MIICPRCNEKIYRPIIRNRYKGKYGRQYCPKCKKWIKWR